MIIFFVYNLRNKIYSFTDIGLFEFCSFFNEKCMNSGDFSKYVSVLKD